MDENQVKDEHKRFVIDCETKIDLNDIMPEPFSAKTTGAYLNMNGIFNFGGTVSPKNAASSPILNRTLRKISPKYIPEIIFSKICR